MALRNYKIRLYYAHDLDLVSYMRHYKFDVSKTLYCALSSFCKGESFVLKTPPKREDPLNKRKVYSRSLYIDTEKDKNILELLEGMSSGYRNNFFKNILRFYIANPMVSEFFVDSECMQFAEDCFKMFRKGRKVVKIEEIKKEKRRTKDSSKKEKIKEETKEEIVKNIDKKETKKDITKENKEEVLEENREEDNENLSLLFSEMFF